MSSQEPVVVVGYDGSPAACAAVAFAAQRAGEGGRMYVVHCYHEPADYIGSIYYQDMVDQAAARARELIERMPTEIGGLERVEWYPEVLAGRSAQAIAEVAETRGANQIVVGSRGHGRGRALLGSVSHELIHLAGCPVTVIPERAVERAAAGRAAKSSSV